MEQQENQIRVVRVPDAEKMAQCGAPYRPWMVERFMAPGFGYWPISTHETHAEAMAAAAKADQL